MAFNLDCSACGGNYPAYQQHGNFIDYGWAFDWVDIGYYGGFTDSYLSAPAAPDERLVHFCHDCCVKLLSVFPMLAEKMQAHGGHPNMNDHDSENGILTPPCCPYAWTWVRDKSVAEYSKQFTTYRATADLQWEAMPRAEDDFSD